MDKFVLQIMDGQNWEHALIMVNNNLGKLDLKVVALGAAIVPIFAPGKLRSALQEAIDKGLSLEICSVSMAAAGLSEATPPKGALTKPGLIAISEARKDGFLYFVVA
ncbi:hypothetical protein [Acidithiobacillus thiooxidans]|uniref:hypothetical protein n=2 Tax=Acidithiobacillus TaxID=119977 RepID=UPI001C079E5A|nr:hypothetical protein [Acidithiobacillus thiooxidans]MBU2844044.1 hypothetical protein [Acidithiobacillus thiooxidans]